MLCIRQPVNLNEMIMISFIEQVLASLVASAVAKAIEWMMRV